MAKEEAEACHEAGSWFPSLPGPVRGLCAAQTGRCSPSAGDRGGLLRPETQDAAVCGWSRRSPGTGCRRGRTDVPPRGWPRWASVPKLGAREGCQACGHEPLEFVWSEVPCHSTTTVSVSTQHGWFGQHLVCLASLLKGGL